MSTDLVSLTRCLALAPIAGAILLLSGCTSWPAGRPWEPLLSDVQTQSFHENPAPADPRAQREALRSPIARQRLAVLQAWSDAPPRPLPVEAIDLRSDPDPRVRAAALTVFVRAQVPQVLAYLTSALEDNDLQVRTAAIAALGELGGPEAQATLEKAAKNEAEVLRAAAVTALAQLGTQPAVFEASTDRSWRVRLAVAQALRRFPNRQGIVLAQRLLNDPSAGVQQETVKAVAAWPLAQAGPILLEAMGSTSYTTRKTAAQELSTRWPPANAFLVDAPAERLAVVVAQLTEQFREEVGPTEIRLVSAALAEDDASAQQAGHLASAETARSVLDRLEADDVLVRRRAARELIDATAEHPLNQASLARLTLQMTKETDSLVWQDVLRAIASDDREPAARLACAALKHASPEVRRRGCQHLAAHPDVQHAPALVDVLADDDILVVGAAARALGALERLDDVEPLKQLLVNRNELLRLEVAAALTRLHDPAGLPALERLTYSADPAVRRQLAVVLGELGRSESLPLLIYLLDDRPDIRRAALESLPKVAGHDVGRPLGKPQPGPAEQAALWKEWFAGGKMPK